MYPELFAVGQLIGFPPPQRFDHIAISCGQAVSKGESVRRLAGRLRAQLEFSQIDEILAGGLHPYLVKIQKECANIHSAIHDVYISYAIEAALEA